MASPEHNSSQPAVSSSAVAGGAHGDSPSAEAQGTGTETEPSAATTVRGTKRRLTSAVWDEFTKDDAKQQAQCMYCKKWLSAGSKAGTTHLSNHLKTCPAKCAPVGLKQQKLKLTENVDGSVNFGNNDGVFEAALARKELALMICVHEYPLSIVEHALFRKFCQTLQPLFKMVCRNTIRKDILDMHAAQKELMVRYFANLKYRVAITSDMWTAGHQKKGYMVVTAHYIDESWNLKSFLLRFAYVPCPHNGEVICQALYECLVDWHLEGKVSTITLDNCTSNDKAVDELTDKLNLPSLMLNGKYLHMRCCAHVLNLIVKDGMNVMEKGIGRVRDSVAYWSATPKRHEKFEKMAKTLNIKYSRRLNLDCKTRWNSTYIMLDIALQYIPIFEKLSKREKMFAKENCCPTDEDWKFARELCDRLKVFFDITVLFSGTKYVTANLFFPKICAIRLSIRKWSTSDDPLIQKMSEEMKTKFEKYWKDVHGLMAVATVLDPRYKLHMLQAMFISLYGYEYANREVERIRTLMVDLLEEYGAVEDGGWASKPGSTAASTETAGTDEAMQIFSAYMLSQPVVSASRARTELDLYLEEANIPLTTEVDIIGWWKFGGIKYPTLQRMAHDILAIPVTTVASESAFSTSGRVLSAHRGSLAPNMAEALMCMQAWSRADMLGDCNSTLYAEFQSVLADEEEEMDEDVTILTEE
ncbi:hypothetical protein ACQ4PT_043104 [Festuca glaucescens]